MERRQFLASLAAAPVALACSSALATAEIPQLRILPAAAGPESSDTFFWIARRYDDDGELDAVRIIGDDEALSVAKSLRRYERGAGSVRFARVRFRPAIRQRRFLLVKTSWWPGGETADELSGEFADPVSLIDIPNEDGDAEAYIEPGDWLTREEAFSEAARRNGESAAARVDEVGYVTGCAWWNVVEFGRQVCQPIVHYTIERGVGHASSEVEYPTRLVAPTEGERAMYPIPVGLSESVS